MRAQTQWDADNKYLLFETLINMFMLDIIILAYEATSCYRIRRVSQWEALSTILISWAGYPVILTHLAIDQLDGDKNQWTTEVELVLSVSPSTKQRVVLRPDLGKVKYLIVHLSHRLGGISHLICLSQSGLCLPLSNFIFWGTLFNSIDPRKSEHLFDVMTY